MSDDDSMKKNGQINIRGDQVIIDEKTNTLKSAYLNSAENIIQKLNRVSPTMCLAKWYTSSIHLTTGRTQSCYHPPTHEIPASELLINPSALHNTEYKKEQRAKMLRGERPEECSYCWKIEDSGDKKNLSDRAYRSSDVFTDSILNEAIEFGAEGNPTPRSVEVSFSQKCNFKCSYCSPHLSSAWHEEIFKNGPYHLNEYIHNDLRGLAGLGLMPAAEKTQKYVEAFWQWWPELYKNLKTFKITGGEPLLDDNTFKVFDYVFENPKKDLQLYITSNCNPPKDKWNQFMAGVLKMTQADAVDHFMLFCSIDSWGKQAEYIRNGLNFNELHENISEFLEKTEKTSLTFIITFNVFSVVGFLDLLKEILNFRKKYSINRQKIWIDIPILQSPDWLSIKLLSKDFLKYLKDAVDFVELNLETPDTRFQGFKDFELAKIKSIYDLLNENAENEQIIIQRKQLIKFCTEQDKRRNTNFRNSFFEMSDFFDLCEQKVKNETSKVDAAQGEEHFFEMTPGSYQDYKKKIIDPISKSFCAAKWYNSTIWLGAGLTASCHHPKAHRIPLSEVKENYKAIHNTEFKKKQRKMMLDGVRPPECEYCWKIEDIQRDNVSDRVFKTVIYKEEDVKSLKGIDWKKDIDLKTLEISFDRTCNLACSYCNPGFSSTWVKDIQQNGPYKNLNGDGADHYTSTNDWGQLYKANEENEYINAFWKWWPELSKTLFELRVTGGEPLMSPQFWRLVDWFTTNEGTRIRFAANTNLSSNDDLIDRLIEKSHKIKTFDLYTSCESIDQQAEYIRDGLNYQKWKKNLIKVIEKGKFRKVVIMMTVNSLCLFGITDFMNEMLELKKKYGRDYPIFSINILRYPSFQSAAVLPDHIKLKAKEKIQTWFEENKNSLSLHQFEFDCIQRLIDYLDVVKTPHPNAQEQTLLWTEFKNFYTQYDIRRNKNIFNTFPEELTKWMVKI